MFRRLTLVFVVAVLVPVGAGTSRSGYQCEDSSGSAGPLADHADPAFPDAMHDQLLPRFGKADMPSLPGPATR